MLMSCQDEVICSFGTKLAHVYPEERPHEWPSLAQKGVKQYKLTQDWIERNTGSKQTAGVEATAELRSDECSMVSKRWPRDELAEPGAPPSPGGTSEFFGLTKNCTCPGMLNQKVKYIPGPTQKAEHPPGDPPEWNAKPTIWSPTAQVPRGGSHDTNRRCDSQSIGSEEGYGRPQT